MTGSIFQFAQNFEKLKSDFISIQQDDLRLLTLVSFWDKHKNTIIEPKFRSYRDEFISFIKSSMSDNALDDLPMHSLMELDSLIGRLLKANSDLIDILMISTINLAKRYFYVGEIESGLDLCNSIIQKPVNIPVPENRLSEFDTFSELCGQARITDSELHEILFPILVEWEGIKESVKFTGANCLFVEKDQFGNLYYGRLKTLRGSVELFAKSQETDEITFENIAVKPDEPFIGVYYDAITSVRSIFSHFSLDERGRRFYHAHFFLENGGEKFTGDSIGLAAAMFIYIKLLRTEIARQDRFLAADIAFTGSIDKEGNILQVNDDSLHEKVERVFFSPMKYLVIPSGNKQTGENILNSLKRKYPSRRLNLITASHISDLIENHNVIRSEKVCFGEYIGKKAVKYSRMAKIQVPLLLAFVYLLACLIYPPAWIGFDDNPQYVEITENGFIVYNEHDYLLWEKKYDCNALDTATGYAVVDINADSKNEVLIVPRVVKSNYCDCNGWLFAYDNRGKLLFKNDCFVNSGLSGTNRESITFGPDKIKVFEIKDSTIILTGAAEFLPCRTHLKFWSSTGEELGCYIHRGAVPIRHKYTSYIDNCGFVFAGINNPMGSVALFVLPRYGSHGVSPPFGSQPYQNMDEIPGNQVKYILFPPTDLNRHLNYKYNILGDITVRPDSVIIVGTIEDIELHYSVFYYLNFDFRVETAVLGDAFTVKRKNLVEQGKLPYISDSLYTSALMHSVAYWTDSGWITEGEIQKLEKSIH